MYKSCIVNCFGEFSVFVKFTFIGEKLSIMVIRLKFGVEIRRVDSQGRLILPADWRESEMGENREVYVIKRRGYLKIIPRRRVDLTKNFDGVDLGVDVIGEWRDFEGKIRSEGL